MKTRLDKQIEFIKEIDKEKLITRQTLLTNGTQKEDDAQHAWHMSIMALLLNEYANEKIDVLKTISMILIHDIVEIDAGDTYAYDQQAIQTQKEREQKAAKRIFGLLPEDQAANLIDLWNEFEENKTPEAQFAHTIDNVQPVMLNDATNGKMWQENQIKLSQILNRNKETSLGSNILWNYSYKNFIKPNVEKKKIIDDINS